MKGTHLHSICNTSGAIQIHLSSSALIHMTALKPICTMQHSRGNCFEPVQVPPPYPCVDTWAPVWSPYRDVYKLLTKGKCLTNRPLGLTLRRPHQRHCCSNVPVDLPHAYLLVLAARRQYRSLLCDCYGNREYICPMWCRGCGVGRVRSRMCGWWLHRLQLLEHPAKLLTTRGNWLGVGMWGGGTGALCWCSWWSTGCLGLIRLLGWLPRGVDGQLKGGTGHYLRHRHAAAALYHNRHCTVYAFNGVILSL